MRKTDATNAMKIEGMPKNREELREYMEDMACIFSDFFFIGFGACMGSGIAFIIINTIWQSL